jgi:hypothetical protein
VPVQLRQQLQPTFAPPLKKYRLIPSGFRGQAETWGSFQWKRKARAMNIARASGEGAKLEGEAKGALEDTRITVHAADYAKSTRGLINGG